MSATRKIKGHDVFVFICFLFVSVCLWLLKAMNERFEADIVVDVVVTNVPDGVEIEDQDALGVDVYVRDLGSELVEYTFGKSPQIRVSFFDFKDNDGKLSMPVSMLENRVAKSLKSSTTFLHFKDDSLQLSVRKISRELPLRVDYDIETARHHELVGVVPSVSTVVVTGPPSVVDGMQSVELPGLLLKNVRKDTLVIIPLSKERYIDYKPAEVAVQLSVAPFAVKSVISKVHVLGRDSGQEVQRYDVPDSVLVCYRTPSSVTGGISGHDFRVEIDFADISGEKPDSVALKVVTIPSSVDRRDVVVVPAFVHRKRVGLLERLGIISE